MKKQKTNLMKRLIVLAVASLFLVMAVNSEVKAVTQSAVVEQLNRLVSNYENKTATNGQMYQGSQCKGFANWVFLQLFNVYIGPYPDSANYKISNPQAQTVGIIEPGNLTEESSRNLLQRAKPGDYIQVQRSIQQSNGKCGPHSMIVMAVNSNGVEVFDCNSDGKNTIRKYLYTWSKFNYDNRAMSLYHANGYIEDVEDPPYGSGQSPVGHLDNFSDGDGGIWLGGWAYDPDRMSVPIELRIEVGGSVYTAKADQTVGGYGDDKTGHAINRNVSVNERGEHNVKVWAIDLTGNENTLLGEKTLMIKSNNAPIGAVDAIGGGKNVIGLSGWAHDADTPGEQVTLRLEVVGGSSYTFTTSGIRENGYPDFSVRVPVKERGTHQVKIYVLDQGPYKSDLQNTLIKTETVTIDSTNMPPIGAVDAIGGGENVIGLSGWADDPDTHGEQMTLRLEVVGSSSYTFETGELRENGYPGFAVRIPVKERGQYQVKVYALDQGVYKSESQNTLLKTTTVTITAKHINSYIDTNTEKISSTVGAVNGLDGTLKIEGWAQDINGIEKVEYEILDDHSDGGVKGICEHRKRDDVANKNPGYPTGNEGFYAFIPYRDIRYAHYYPENMKIVLTAYCSGGGVHSLGTIEIKRNFPEKTGPVISDIQVIDVSTQGYTVKAVVSDESGIDRVEFPTWTLENGQDDITREQGVIVGNEVAIRVNTADHNNEAGVYKTHIYAYDTYGNYTAIPINDKGGEINVPAKQNYIIAYDANGGSGAPPAQLKPEGQDIVLSSMKPVLPGYVFTGWKGIDKNYQAGGIYSNNQDETLYAIWDKVPNLTEGPVIEPTSGPIQEPTPEPTNNPVVEPTEEPTPGPTNSPVVEPTEEPTPEPTNIPVVEPTGEPAPDPTNKPTGEPSPEPSEIPPEKETQNIIVTPDAITLYMGGNGKTLKVSNVKGKVTYSTSNPKVAKVSAKGKVLPVSKGKAVIYIYAGETDDYKETVHSIKVTVYPRPAIAKSVKAAPAKKKGTLKVTWRKVSESSGYVIKYSYKKNMKNSKSIKIPGGNTTAKTIKKLSSKKYVYIQVQAYSIKKGMIIPGKWSKIAKSKGKIR